MEAVTEHVKENDLEITAAEAHDWLAHKEATLIDVRFPEEIEIFGPLPGAHHLPLSCLQRYCGFAPDPHCEEFSVRDLSVGERSTLTKALVTYARRHHKLICLCRSGNRSLAAARILRELGYDDAYSLTGGVLVWEGQE